MGRNRLERRAVDEPDHARARLPRAHRVKRRRHVGVAGMRTGLSVLYAAVAGAIVCLALLAVPCQAQAQSDVPVSSVHPQFRWRVEAPLLSAGATLLRVREKFG